MIYLYIDDSSGCYRDIVNNGPAMPAEQWKGILQIVLNRLEKSGRHLETELLQQLQFQLIKGTNKGSDDFLALYTTVPYSKYAELENNREYYQTEGTFRSIATAFKNVNRTLRFIVVDLDASPNSGMVPIPQPQEVSETVQLLLENVEQLIKTCGPASAVDRIHAAFHGFLKDVLQRVQVTPSDEGSITSLFADLRKNHPVFRIETNTPKHVLRIIGALATVVDATDPIRNHKSLAHPTKELLDEADSRLVINSINTLFHYLDAKIR